mgnify:CR=1 FL=1
MKRLENPLIYASYYSNKIIEHEYYRINVCNYSIFYVVIEDVIEVSGVLY